MYTKSLSLIDVVDGSVFKILHDILLNVFELHIHIYIFSIVHVFLCLSIRNKTD